MGNDISPSFFALLSDGGHYERHFFFELSSMKGPHHQIRKVLHEF